MNPIHTLTGLISPSKALLGRAHMVLNYPSHFSIKGPKEKKKIQKILSKYAIIEHRAWHKQQLYDQFFWGPRSQPLIKSSCVVL